MGGRSVANAHGDLLVWLDGMNIDELEGAGEALALATVLYIRTDRLQYSSTVQ